MIIVTIKIKVPPDNLKEFIQTVKSLDSRILTVKGCMSHRFYHDMDDENAFIFVEEWKSQADLDNYINSDPFSVLLGAMNILSEAPDIKMNSVTSTAGMEAVNATRA